MGPRGLWPSADRGLLALQRDLPELLRRDPEDAVRALMRGAGAEAEPVARFLLGPEGRVVPWWRRFRSALEADLAARTGPVDAAREPSGDAAAALW